MGVPQPVEASGFADKVVLADYLTPTGSQYSEPASLALPTPVIALVEGNNIRDFNGDAAAVVSVRAHYEAVAQILGIEPYYYHSWHAASIRVAITTTPPRQLPTAGPTLSSPALASSTFTPAASTHQVKCAGW